MDNKYNTYDVVKICKPFIVNKVDIDITYDANIEGVIVESFDKEYLIEFIDEKGDAIYALIEEKELIRIWKS